jgi:6-phosphogluconolactonase
MQTMKRGAIAAVLLAVAIAGSLVTGGAAVASAAVVGHVYVNDNTAGVNTVAGFDRHADGTLTPMAGSPFAVGGAGTGTGLASQGSLQLARGGQYLLAVDAGSNQVSVLRIKPDGGLKPSIGGPVSSGGIQPVSIAVHGGLVYVANAGTGGSNYTGFRLNGGGRLSPIHGSTVSVPDGSQPGDILFNGDGTNLAATRVATSLIDSFRVTSDGHLVAAPGSPFPARGARAIRQRVPPDQREGALRLQRAWWNGQRNGLRVSGEPPGHAEPDRAFPVPGPSDRALLGGDLA